MPPSSQARSVSSFVHELESSEALLLLAQGLHQTEIRLGRVAPFAWDELTVQEQQQYRDRQAVALRLGDSDAMTRAAEAAAITIRARHAATLRDFDTSRVIAGDAIATFVSTLSGRKGGR